MIHNFIWNQLRYFNRIPGAYSLFYAFANIYYRDGRVVRLQRGPAAGYRWRHYRGFQPWMAIGVYEPSVAKLIYQSLNPGDVFYDIGANAGYFTLVAAKAVGPTGKVIAFEPMKKNCETIQEQIELNRLEQICDIERFAISNTDLTALLTIPAKNANAHLADVEAPHVRATKQQDTEEVLCISLDSYIAKQDKLKPKLVKIDIEGAEVKALEGATDLINSKDAPIFLITAHSIALGNEVKRILSLAGYSFTNFADMIHAIPNH